MITILKVLYKHKMEHPHFSEKNGIMISEIIKKVEMDKMTVGYIIHKLNPLMVNINSDYRKSYKVPKFVSINIFGQEIVEEIIRRENEFQRSNQPSIQV